jgi:hypothetical protein
MRNVYKLIDKLDDVLFNKYHETYYCNFNMYADKHGLKILELPLIVKIKNGENIKYISDLIRDEIKTLFGFSTCYADNEIKILDDEQLNVIKCDVERKFASYIGIGKIKFNTIRFQQFHHKLIDAIPLTINPEDIPLGYKMLNMQDIEFGIIETKNKKYLIDKSIEYQIFIQFNKVVKDVIDDEPKEVRINRIRELMGLMVDKIEDKKKTEPPTHGIKHWGLCGYLNLSSLINICCNLII